MTAPSSKTSFSLKARLASLRFAARGLAYLFRDEHNAWVHLAAAIAVIATGSMLRLSTQDWRWLVLAIALVWLSEAFNTAIEDLCNHVTPGFHPAIGRVKDIAAGAVLIAAVAAGIIGLMTLGPPLLATVAS